MRTKLFLLIAMLTLAIAVIGSTSASAATLYTTTAHTTAVPVGTTFSATTPNLATNNYSWSQAGSVWLQCQTATYSFTVTQNSAGVFKATSNGAGTSWNNCLPWGNPSQKTAATLQVSGSSITVGTGKAWLGTTLNSVALDMGTYGTVLGSLVSATGNPPANGASAQQPAAAAPVTLALANAGTLTWPSFGTFTVTANYTFTGAAANYSLA